VRNRLSFEVRDLRLIRAIAERGTLTGAGRDLHLTQPALSRQLRDLERRVGVSLFTRTRRQMIPTAAGRRLVEHARNVLSALHVAESEATQLRDSPLEQLRLSAECYTVYHWLPRILSRFRLLHPACEVELVTEMTHDPLPGLVEGTIDLAIVTNPTGDRRLRFVPVFDDEVVLAVAPGHTWAGRSHLTPDALDGQPIWLITATRHSSVYSRFIGPSSARPKVTVVQLTEAAVAMAEAGFGAAALARWAIAPHVKAGTLVPLRLGPNGIRRTWYVATRRAQSRERHLADFAALVAAHSPVSDARPGTPAA